MGDERRGLRGSRQAEERGSIVWSVRDEARWALAGLCREGQDCMKTMGCSSRETGLDLGWKSGCWAHLHI